MEDSNGRLISLRFLITPDTAKKSQKCSSLSLAFFMSGGVDIRLSSW